MLQRLVEKKPAFVDDEAERAVEDARRRTRRVHAVRRVCAQGVGRCGPATSSASATIASSDRERPGSDDLGLEVGLERVEDRPPEPFGKHERGDRREADRRDGRDPHAGEDGRQRERDLDAHQRLGRRQPHAAGGLEHVRRNCPQALERVAEEDQERVADERDLDRRHGQAGDRHEQLEEREAGNGVEERGDEAERPLEPALPVGEQGRGERDREADADREQRQADVLEERGLEGVVPVVAHPVGAEEPVLDDAVRAAPKSGITGPALARRSLMSASSLEARRTSTPRGGRRRRDDERLAAPSREHHGERVAQSGVGARGSPRPRRRRARARARRAAQREPPQAAVLADEARDEVVDRLREDRVRRVVLGEDPSLAQDRDPVAERIASSMSCVTKMTVFRTSPCRRRNSLWSRSRVIGSSAPNGSSISITAGSAASARARPTRWRWPPESCAG